MIETKVCFTNTVGLIGNREQKKVGNSQKSGISTIHVYRTNGSIIIII